MQTETKISAHSGICELYCSMENQGVTNVFDRYQLQQPQCAFGKLGICCQLCSHGPCRITRKTDRGICGADANTIAARNLIRLATHGTGAYSHHFRTTIKTFKTAAEGGFPGINDVEKLSVIAESLGIDSNGEPSELVHLAPAPPVGGADVVANILTSDVESLTGGKLLVELQPAKAAEKIEEHILKKREGLGI